LKRYAKRESEEAFEQRVELTEHVVTAVVGAACDFFTKVPRSTALRKLLSYSGDGGEEKASEFSGVLDKMWGGRSLEDFNLRLVELNKSDPNSAIITEVDMAGLPYLVEVEAQDVLYIERSKRGLVGIVCRRANRDKIYLVW
jgi:hypothetical protein